MHRNLAFPLLKALVKAGDRLAKKVFKEEIAVRLESGYPSVLAYLIKQNYLKYLTRRELDTILENPDFIQNFIDNIRNLTNIPSWFYKKIKKFIPKNKRRSIYRAIYRTGYDATFKVVLFGDSGVPKSQLTQRYLTNLFRSDTKMTIGVDFEVKSLLISGYRVKLQIWDFGGEERFRFLLPTYCRGANGAMFVYDAANSSSLAHINGWLSVVRREIRSEEDIFPIIVVGVIPENKEDRQVSGEEGIEIAKSQGVDGFIECSTRTGENVEETFDALTRLMLQNSGYL
jgi:small GTP-binding protein